MFKGRVQIWMATIASCLILTFLFNAIPNFFTNVFAKTEATVTVKTVMDDTFITDINKAEVNKIAFTYTTDPRADIIIQDSSDETIEGYTKYSNELTSTLVLYVRNMAVNNSTGFIDVTSSNNTPLSIDFKSVLEGMESGMEWKDLNISTKVVKGTISICIPQKSDPWYPLVEELFYITLNNGKTPTAEERADMRERVNSLLDQCTNVSSINQSIADEYSKPSTNYKVFIGPEYLTFPTGKHYSRSNTNGYIPVYINNSPTVSMDVFVREDSEMASKFITAITQHYNFTEKTGWRVKDYTFDMGYISYSMKDFI